MRLYHLFFGLLSVCALPASAQMGVLDPSFDNDGIVRTDANSGEVDVVSDIAIQADGKVIAVGYTTLSSLNQFCLVRYNTDGSLDNSFGANGIVITSFSINKSSRAAAVALQSDGKIVVAGTEQGLAMVRYNTDGSPDNSFGTAGKVILTTLAYVSTSDVLVQPDGKIILSCSSVIAPPDGTDYVFVRFNTDGSLDANFGNAGIVTLDIVSGSGLGALDMLRALTLQSDGKIVGVGISGKEAVVVRLKSNGDMDSTFGTNGIISNDYTATGNSFFNDVLIQPDGKILAIGGVQNATSDMLLARYDASGNADASFGNNGAVVSAYTTEFDVANRVLLLPDNKIIVGGGLSDNGTFQFALHRYDANGNIDATFGNNGLVQTQTDPSRSEIVAMALQSDGKIVVGGDNDRDFLLARYNPYAFPISVGHTSVGNIAATIAPNPSQTSATINYSLQQASNIHIALYTVDGRLVRSITPKTYKTAGQYQQQVDVSNLAAGQYFISISTDEDSHTLKLVVE